MMKSISRRAFLESSLGSTFVLCPTAQMSVYGELQQDKKESAWECADLRLVWDRAVDNEFTDLVRFRGRFFCVFREGLHHTSPAGKARILSSEDGKKWRDEALLTMQGRDLRDPKLSITPDGRLMLCTASVVPKPYNLQSYVCYSEDGHTWGDLLRVNLPEGEWLWRVTWHNGKAYTVTRNLNPKTMREKTYRTRLYTSEDGLRWDVLVPMLYDVSGPNESTLRFAPDGTCYCLSRRHPPELVAVLGTSKPPYRRWSWKPLNYFIGGPNFLRIPSGEWLVSGRVRFVKPDANRGKTQTAVCRLDPCRGELTSVVRLPGNGGYCGMVWHDEKLWVTTYSNHEGGKNRIYLTELRKRSS
ncbi:MAG: exo-alpha-sialidase [Pirellulales bacterium]|nr:exo-alpha-sialidase [Pirellulales bacterium]